MYDAGSMNLRSLKIFIAVFEAENFSVVARREGLSASQVSRIIHQLEDALGQQLFYRNTRAVIPTESGHLFIRYAREMMTSFEEARRELDARSTEPSGTIRINAPVFFGQRHIAPGLPDLTARYPRLNIELTLTDDFIDPHKNAADVIFRIGVLTDSTFHARIFGQQRYHLAASPDYLRQHGAPQGPDDLAHHKCLVYRGSSGPNRWLLRGAGEEWVHYPVMPLMTSNNAESLLAAALGGMGIVLFPDWLIGDRLQQGELVALLPGLECAIHTEPLNIAAIYPNARHPPLNVRAVIDHYVGCFGTPLYWQTQGR
ncbi:LysR family transcriptional regulator [Enterobacter cloacae]|mgnify:FL=1|uniref:Transcriptional regulator, LysR family n=1 Tax=Enterobacter cloacae subsp. cloacae (strain ATCC 13047 / DSM 30054 / NBRC 13535 / NCTC 10005 / WDCM 00083 / NCDC 279-56) TaxID=716541 RepID=A0A0H3CK19_ENTCC|nr:LysR family transcriptional regulator [Enterobacter cloacae]ADF61646.1 transcriptional regulator, LysR family [Enterobacter cloacae subsp. cloacae ATCC 13047]KGB10893.1 bacterial regulatory helix-turn-helix, lysR family protein [Enterobacter cloacae]MBW4205119.1 LysR family transcriptional regulator [Enterobacter cloacae subsp. cloacae]MBW4228256.1 LysR family transcriptional regulator [Enterobacter cloacae subsp. cloacae]MCJ8537605.1 LysR family transcriptional regulator [Enterobacter cloa